MLFPGLRFHTDGQPIWADWSCPVCGTYTPKTARPGRPNVYCTNACRQKAYRFRRKHGIRLLHGDGQPTERAAGDRVAHLLRPRRDPVSWRRASNREAVSLCGAFVRPGKDRPFLPTEFLFDSAKSCLSCCQLTGAGRPERPPPGGRRR
jgi:hypothetical protein